MMVPSHTKQVVRAPLLDLPLPTLPRALAQAIAAGNVALFSEQLVATRQQGWAPQEALKQAHGALQLGLIEQADELVLEADGLQPYWGIVPDRWGLWPIDSDQIAQSDAAERERCLQLVDAYLFLRHLPALELWRSWLAPVQERWQRAADPRQLSLMGLLLGRAEQLPAPLEPAIEQLVGEEQVAADPSAALAVWEPLCRRLPQWTYARLKAADLCLQMQHLNTCSEHLETASVEQRQLPWLFDIKARLAIARQQPQEALRWWEEAIRRAAPAATRSLRNSSDKGGERRNGRPN